MIKCYAVQTFYGTMERIFLNHNNAERYYKELCKQYDSDLIEFYTVPLTHDDFLLTDFSD